MIALPDAILTPDELDNLIYSARAGDLPALQSDLSLLSARLSLPISTLLSSAIDVDADGCGSRSSLLHFSAANGHVDVVQYLLEQFGRGEVGDQKHNSEERKMSQMLGLQNVSGNTPLHWAAMNGRLEVVKMLVAAGADPGVRNAAGRDVVVEAEVAGREGGEECAVWLLGNWKGVETAVGFAREGGGNGEGEEAEDVLEEDGGAKPKTNKVAEADPKVLSDRPAGNDNAKG